VNPRQDPSHDRWEELAAGYALHALEPDEESTFVDHLATCARCRTVLDDHALVAAQLGALAEDSDVVVPSWSRMRSAIVPATDAPTAITSLDEQRERRRRRPRMLGAAAAVVLIAGGVTAGWQLSRDNSNGPTSSVAIADCRSAPGCHVVSLEGKAVVLADATRARVVSEQLPTPPAGHVYALWQMPRDGGPALVTVLDSPTAGVPSAPAALALPYDETAAFAISVEPADVTPTHPTDVVAVGTATSV
jgi:anti-sigma-K factor RskA